MTPTWDERGQVQTPYQSRLDQARSLDQRMQSMDLAEHFPSAPTPTMPWVTYILPTCQFTNRGIYHVRIILIKNKFLLTTVELTYNRKKLFYILTLEITNCEKSGKVKKKIWDLRS